MTRLGFRSRLVFTVLAMVILVTVALGVASWVLVRGSLRSDLVDSATEQAAFVVGVLAPERFDDDPTAEEIAASPFLADVRLGPDDGLLVDLEGSGDFSSGFAFTGPPPPDLAALVAEGQLAYEWVDIGGNPYLAVGGSFPGGPPIYLYYSAASIEDTLGDLLTAEVIAGVVVVAIAGIGVGSLARRVLTPVGAAADAATRIASGDLSARLDEGSEDELGRMVAAFNQMAGSLEESMGRLQRSGDAQRRFVADVSHELRTPLTALVNETAMLADHADDLPPGDRRLVELLDADVARMRLLVDDLLEISRIDAADSGALQHETPTIDLRSLVTGVVEARSPGAVVMQPSAAGAGVGRCRHFRPHPGQPARQRGTSRNWDGGGGFVVVGWSRPPNRCRQRPGRAYRPVGADLRAFCQARPIALGVGHRAGTLDRPGSRPSPRR